MRAYSQDLRERVIAALKASDHTQAAIAAQFGIAQSTLEKWWARWKATGSCAAWNGVPGPRRKLRAHVAFLRAEVARQPDIPLAVLGERLRQAQRVQASPSTLCRELQRLRLRRKKSRSTTASATRPASKRHGPTFSKR